MNAPAVAEPQTRLGIRPDLAEPISIYLDALRVIATAAVFFSHSVEYHLYEGGSWLIRMAHGAVIIFFVLSGIVISATAARPKETAVDFIVARAARLYSVTLPSIVLCVTLGLAYAALHGGVFDDYWQQNGPTPAKLVMAVFFFLQSWRDEYLPWNAPYWTLCYEAWYYVIFGFLLFARKSWRIPSAIIAALVAGPAIVALFPVWWLGVEFMRRPKLSFGKKYVSFAVFFLSIVAVVIISDNEIDLYFRRILHDNVPLFWTLHNSQRIVTDYALGLLTLANIIAFRDLQHILGPIALRLAGPIRIAAGYTFSVYLFHFPLIMLFAREFPNIGNSLIYYWVLTTTILIITIVLGKYTEKKKGFYRKSIRASLQYLIRSYKLLVVTGR